MSNRKELLTARRKAAEAAAELAGIESLPRRRGQRVRWSNGVIWTREGDDQWRPTSSAGYIGDMLYSSAHVAATRTPWVTLSPEPDVTEERP